MSGQLPHEQLRSLPDSVPASDDVELRGPRLPFDLMSWENFERLIFQLAEREDVVEQCSRYGRPGQAQFGIDIYARKRHGRYDVWQVKRYKKYTVASLKATISSFLAGPWAAKTDCLLLAISTSLSDTKLQDAIEAQSQILRQKGIALKALGADELESKLRPYEDIVLAFFGKRCAKQFYGDSAKTSLDSLDGNEFNKVRKQLLAVYRAQFNMLDPGAVGGISAITNERMPSLLDRFVPPDIIPIKIQSGISDNFHSTPDHNVRTASSEFIPQNRIPIAQWLTNADRFALIGDAGCGKSTTLRATAFDLLLETKNFPGFSNQFVDRIPVYISFARWVRLVEENGGHIGLKTYLKAVLQHFLTVDILQMIDQAIDEKRVILLIDGLDEWSNEQAARTTFLGLLAIISAHELPAIMTARPGGLLKIGNIPQDWIVGRLAPFSSNQQERLAKMWFRQQAQDLDTANQDLGKENADRFLLQLRRDPHLFDLAETPLLLLGLAALSVRNIPLPSNKVIALEKIIDILLEDHPGSRATASDDVASRFRAVVDPEARRDALAALAFRIRTEGEDAGLRVREARSFLFNYFSDPHKIGMGRERAALCASELVAVNAETVGLLVEKLPGEIGFMHASLEELLCARHIGSWTDIGVEQFVREHAGNPRWRNVIANLLLLKACPPEILRLIGTIEQQSNADIIEEVERTTLLAEITFNNVNIPLWKARELAGRFFAIVEGAGWTGQQERLLASMLRGTPHPTIRDLLADKLEKWAIKRQSYEEEILQEFATWEPCIELLGTLLKMIRNDDFAVARAAGLTIAKLYLGDADVLNSLLGLLRSDSTGTTARAVLEACAIGWPDAADTEWLTAQALKSRDPKLVQSGLYSVISRGKHRPRHLALLWKVLVQDSLHTYVDLSAVDLLSKGWPDNAILINRCILASRSNIPENESKLISERFAARYLLSCTADCVYVQRWILDQLMVDASLFEQGSFSLSLLQFAAQNAEILEALISAIAENRLKVYPREYSKILDLSNDRRLIELLYERALRTDRYDFYEFAILIFERGARCPEEVRSLTAAFRSMKLPTAARATLLPHLITDQAECRSALLELAKADSRGNQGLLLKAFRKIKCDLYDTEIFSTLLSGAESQSHGGGLDEFIRCYYADERVRNLCIRLLEFEHPPIPPILHCYKKDTEIKKLILQRFGYLNVELRYLIASHITRADGTNKRIVNTILKKYSQEVNLGAQVLLAIRYFEEMRLTSEAQTLAARLIKNCVDKYDVYEEPTQSTFVGIVVLDALRDFSALKSKGKPLQFRKGLHFSFSHVLMWFTVLHWNQLVADLGEDFLERFEGSFDGAAWRGWEPLSRFVGMSEAASQAFIRYCIEANRSLSESELQKLADVCPGTDLLRSHCRRILEEPANAFEGGFYRTSFANRFARAIIILRRQFVDYSDLASNLEKKYAEGHERRFRIALAGLAPHRYREILYEEKGTQAFRPYHLLELVFMSSTFDTAGDFLLMARKTVNRDFYSELDLQEAINSVILNRLDSDAELSDLMGARLGENATTNELASFSRYLAAAGKLNDVVRNTCERTLADLLSRRGVPLSAFDAVSNRFRSVAHSLFDVLVAD
jgi:NACHT domain